MRINLMVGNYRNGVDLDFEADDDRTRFQIEVKSAEGKEAELDRDEVVKLRDALNMILGQWKE